MKLSVAVSTFPSAFAPLMLSGNLPGHLPRLADMGFEGIDLFIRRADEPDISEVVQSIRRTGLSVCILAAVSAFVDEGLYLSAPDPAIRSAMLERMRGQVRLAAELGAMVPIGLLRGRDGGVEREKLLAESLFELHRFAQPLGVDLILEPVNRYETRLINTVHQALDFLQCYDLPPLGLLPDTFHMNIEEVSIERSLLAAGARCAHLHLADSNRHVPGKGHTPFTPIFKALSAIHYAGFLGLECIPAGDPWQDLADTLRFLHSWRG